MSKRLSLDEAINKYGDFYLISGMGDDSAMMIAMCYLKGYEPKAILFSDTGNELPRTYKFIEHLKKWIDEKKWSKLIILNKKNAKGEVINVYDDNYKNGRLPPPVYGYKTCSHKFKIEVVNRFIDNNYECWWQMRRTSPRYLKGTWSGKVIKAIGINADEDSRIDSWQECDKYEQVYPLVDWDIGELEAAKKVHEVGLYMPGKSSCFMCPNMKEREIVDLYENNRHLFDKAIDMENNVIAMGNDYCDVERVFVTDGENEIQLENKHVKKVDKKICLETTFEAIPRRIKVKLRLVKSETGDLFEEKERRLIIKRVRERSNFIGLGRSVSWSDVIKYYQYSGQTDFFDSIGGEMCANGVCGT